MRSVRLEVIGPEKHVRPLLEMRTALLETSAAKSMRVNGKSNILLLPKFVLSTMSHESEHSESEFYYPDELSHAELLYFFSRQLTPKAKKEI